MTDSKPLISVLIPAYNSELWIKDCIESVIGQSYKNLEILIYNDGSVDNTNIIIDQFLIKDSRITLIGNERIGIADARNLLLEKSNGEAIIFIDSDDWIESNCIEVLANHLINDNLDFCGCSIFHDRGKNSDAILATPENTYSIFDRQSIVNQYISLAPLHGSVCNKLFRASSIKEFKFNSGWEYAEDSNFVWKALQNVHAVGITPLQLYHYRRHPGSLSERNFKESHLNFIISWNQIINDVKQKYTDLFQEACKSYSYLILSILYSIARSNYRDNNAIQKLLNEIRLYRTSLLKKIKFRPRFLIFYTSLSISWPLTAYLCKILKKFYF